MPKAKKKGDSSAAGAEKAAGTGLYDVAAAMLERHRVEEMHLMISKENTALKGKVSKLEQDLRKAEDSMGDNNEHLQRIITAKTEQAGVLASRVAELEEELSVEKAHFDASISNMRDRDQRRVESLEATILQKDEELRSVSQFIEEKEALTAGMEQLQQKLESQELAGQEKIRDLERRIVEENERMVAETQARVEETKRSMQAKMQNELDTTTKRTIEENEEMSTELRFQSHRTEQLVVDNRSLHAENTQLRRELNVMRGMQDEMAKRLRIYDRLLGKMRSRETAERDGALLDSPPIALVSSSALGAVGSGLLSLNTSTKNGVYNQCQVSMATPGDVSVSAHSDEIAGALDAARSASLELGKLNEAHSANGSGVASYMQYSSFLESRGRAQVALPHRLSHQPHAPAPRSPVTSQRRFAGGRRKRAAALASKRRALFP